MLLGRHRVIDALLEEAIADGRAGQVLEVAAGMSPRGWRFTERHPALLYVEAALPDMAARKRAALERIGRPPTHRAVDIDALADGGPLSLDAVADGLDDDQGLAIITEGLLSYLPRDAVLKLWSGFARTITRFGRGVYLADLHLDTDASPVISRPFAGLLSAFVRSPVTVHFADEDEARATLLDAGFSEVALDPASDHPEGAGLAGAQRVRGVRAVARWEQVVMVDLRVTDPARLRRSLPGRRGGRLRRRQAPRGRSVRHQAHVGLRAARGQGIARRLLAELEDHWFAKSLV